MKHLLSLLCATGLLAGLVQPARGSVSLLDGLSFYLDFEGAAPVDSSGNNVKITNTGVTSNTLTGHHSEVPPPALAGNAGFFNRSEKDWLRIGASYGSTAAPSGGTALGYSFTISAWYYLQPQNDPSGGGSSGARMFVYEGQSDYDLSYGIRTDLGSSNGSYTGTVYSSGASPTDYSVSNAAYYDPLTNEGAWQNVVETVSLSEDGLTITKKMYLNGELQGTTSYASSVLASPGIHLGTYRSANDRYWDGFMDEVGLWNRALTDVEISDLYDLTYIDGLSVTSLAPEPSRAVLLMLGIVGLHLRRSRRRA